MAESSFYPTNNSFRGSRYPGFVGGSGDAASGNVNAAPQSLLAEQRFASPAASGEAAPASVPSSSAGSYLGSTGGETGGAGPVAPQSFNTSGALPSASAISPGVSSAPVGAGPVADQAAAAAASAPPSAAAQNGYTVYNGKLYKLSNGVRSGAGLSDLLNKNNRAAIQAATSAAGGGKIKLSGRVVCTELVRQGLMSAEELHTDIDYTFSHLTSTHVRGYHFWAKPYARLMKRKDWRGRAATHIIKPFVLSRSHAIRRHLGMTDQFTLFGEASKIFFEGMSFIFGVFVAETEQSSIYRKA